jgi:hypothetical protein
MYIYICIHIFKYVSTNIMKSKCKVTFPHPLSNSFHALNSRNSLVDIIINIDSCYYCCYRYHFSCIQKTSLDYDYNKNIPALAPHQSILNSSHNYHFYSYLYHLVKKGTLLILNLLKKCKLTENKTSSKLS